mmetsp:Transcript_102864/g.300106  ORF Transcript_102864/g.300106 Transcript_102864/m.300106 type:complete len:236 (-) Transcript_102864:529-1236(-)
MLQHGLPEQGLQMRRGHEGVDARKQLVRRLPPQLLHLPAIVQAHSQAEGSSGTSALGLLRPAVRLDVGAQGQDERTRHHSMGGVVAPGLTDALQDLPAERRRPQPVQEHTAVPRQALDHGVVARAVPRPDGAHARPRHHGPLPLAGHGQLYGQGPRGAHAVRGADLQAHRLAAGEVPDTERLPWRTLAACGHGPGQRPKGGPQLLSGPTLGRDADRDPELHGGRAGGALPGGEPP